MGKQKQLLAVNGYFEMRTSPLITESVNICSKNGLEIQTCQFPTHPPPPTNKFYYCYQHHLKEIPAGLLIYKIDLFQLQLLGKVEVPLYHKLDGPIDKTLIDGKISLSDKHCGE